MNRSRFPSRRVLVASFALFGMLSVLAGPALVAPSHAQSCLSAAATRTAISSGRIVPFSTIRNAVQANGYTQIASANVCGSSGAYLYSVIATARDGRSARLVFDGSSGTLVSITR